MSLVGRLEDLALSDIFQILSIGKKTGTLVIKGTTGSAMIVFKNGLVVRAENSALNGTIGHDLLHGSVIKGICIADGAGRKKKLPATSIAEILFELGAVNRDVLEKASKKRIERVVYQLLLWQGVIFSLSLMTLI